VRSGTTPKDRGDGLEGEVILLKTANIQDGFIDDSSLFLISSEIDRRMSNTRLRGRDVLINIVGATLGVIGRVAPLSTEIPPINITQAMALIRITSPDFLPYYVSTFLLTGYGKGQVHRMARPMGQYNINLQELQDVQIVRLPIEQQRVIQKLVLASMVQKEQSKSLYAEAEALLLSELGLDDLDLSHQPTYTRSYSQAWASGRWDAEYFQPKYQLVLEIMGQSGKTIDNVARLAKRRFEPRPGRPFQYIEIGDVGQAGHAESKTVVGEEAPSRAQWVVKAGDVITSTVRPIRRLSALIESEQDDYVCSSGFAVLKPTAIEPEMLLVYLRLPVVCEILDLQTSASMYPAISTTDLLGVPIPIPPDGVRVRVVELVQESRRNRQEAKRLLEQAKQRVEEMVLGEEAS